MHRFFGICLDVPMFASLFFSLALQAQTPPAMANLHEIRVEGLKTLSEAQIIGMSQLEKGSQVGKPDLQAAADRLLQTGMFSKVNYSFQTRGDGLTVTLQLEEAPRVPIFYDNLPWFSDSELADAIRKKVAYFDGTLPEAGAVVDKVSDALKELLVSHQLNLTVEHELLANPLGEGNVQAFRVDGGAFFIASIEFGDPAVAASHVVQQQLSEVQGKPFSRMTIDLFLSEQLRPFYIQQGFLRVTLGPPEVRLTGNPNQKLPDQIPVFVPVSTGAAYHWKEVQWSGNSVLSSVTLTNEIGLKQGEVANGMQIESGWDRAREEYGHRGYLDARIDPVASYDDQAHTVSYVVSVTEGVQYHYNAMVLTGLSVAAEARVHQMWATAPSAVFDKSLFESFLIKLQTQPSEIFGELPVHYETVGHWLRTDPAKHLVDVLLDFK
jgi:outer membrane protein insertion porin family